jgi:transposase-like protein
VVGGGSSAKRARRSWTIDEKRAIVDAATHSGDPVSVVARRHGLNANHLFKWLQPSVSQAPLPAQIDLGAPDSQYFYPRMLTYLLKGRFRI